MTTERSAQTLGALLREWRVRRRMSQLELATDAGISTKHLSFLETGRSRRSQRMLLRLAACLDMPLRYRNTLLASAGMAATFEERALGSPALEMIRRAVETVLAAHDPDPALAVDRHWTMVSANCAVAYLLSGTEPLLLRPPVNIVRLLLHPAGMASRIVNLSQWRGHTIARLRRQIDSNGDPGLMELLDEVREYPGGRANEEQPEEEEPGLIAIPLRIATMDGILSFHNTTTMFLAPVDITVAELSIEAFLPADQQTATIMRRALENDKLHLASRQALAGAIA